MFYHLESILSLSQQFKGKSVQLEYETCQARFQKLVCFSFLLDSQFWVPTQSLSHILACLQSAPPIS